MADSTPEVFYFDAQGKTLAIPADREDALQKAASLGLKQISENDANTRKFKREYEDSTLAPLAYGVAKGLSLGAAPGLLTQLGILDPGEAAGIEEAAPGLTLTGELVGSVAPLAFSGGTSAPLTAGSIATRAGAKQLAKNILLKPTTGVAQFATKTGQKVGARAAGIEAGTAGAQRVKATVEALAPLAVAGSIEGAAYGLGSGYSQAIMENPDASAEDIAASAASGAVSGGLYGGVFGAGLGGLIVGAPVTAKGAANLASKIYKGQIEKHGEAFAKRLSDFVTRSEPEASEMLADEFTKVFNFQSSFSDITKRMQAAEAQIDKIKQMGLDTTAEVNAINTVKAQLDIDIQELRMQKKAASKAMNGIRDILRRTSGKVAKAAEDGRTAFLDDAAQEFDAALGAEKVVMDELREQGVRVIDGKRTMRETAADSAVKKALDDAVAGSDTLVDEMRENFDNYINSSITQLTGIASELAEQANKDVVLAVIEQMRIDAKAIRELFDKGDYFGAFLKQRQLRRNVNVLPSQFRSFATPAARAKENAAIGAVKTLDAYTNAIGERAKMIEIAKTEAIKSAQGLRNALRKTGSIQSIPGALEAAKKNLSDLIGHIDGTPELAAVPSIKSALTTLKSSLDDITKKSEGLNDYNNAVQGMKDVLGLGSNFQDDMIQAIVDEGKKQGLGDVIGKAFDDAVEQLQGYADDLGDPVKLADRIEEIKLDKLKKTKEQRVAREKLAKEKARVNRDDSLTLADLDQKSSLGDFGFGGAGALADLLLGSFIPNIVSYGILAGKGLSYLRKNPTKVLRGTAAILDASSFMANKIRSGAEKSLKFISLKELGEGYKRQSSIMGKLMGLSGSLVPAPYQTPTDEDYEKAVAKIRDLQTNPQKMMDLMEKSASGGQGLQPLRDSLAKTTQRAINYLSTFTPELQPLSPFDRYDPVPTPEQKMRFATALEVINNPINVYYYSLTRNLLDDQVLEPLKQIYPDIYQRLQQQVVSTFVESRTSLPYSFRVQMGLSYGPGMEATTGPAFTSLMQENFSPPGQQQGAGGNMTQGGVNRLRRFASEFTTPMQAIEGA